MSEPEWHLPSADSIVESKVEAGCFSDDTHLGVRHDNIP